MDWQRWINEAQPHSSGSFSFDWQRAPEILRQSFSPQGAETLPYWLQAAVSASSPYLQLSWQDGRLEIEFGGEPTESTQNYLRLGCLAAQAEGRQASPLSRTRWQCRHPFPEPIWSWAPLEVWLNDQPIHFPFQAEWDYRPGRGQLYLVVDGLPLEMPLLRGWPDDLDIYWVCNGLHLDWTRRRPLQPPDLTPLRQHLALQEPQSLAQWEWRAQQLGPRVPAWKHRPDGPLKPAFWQRMAWLDGKHQETARSAWRNWDFAQEWPFRLRSSSFFWPEKVAQTDLYAQFPRRLAELAWQRSLWLSWYPHEVLQEEWLHALLLFRRDLPEVNYLLAQQLLLLPLTRWPVEEARYSAEVLLEAGWNDLAQLLLQRLDSGS